MVKNNFTNKQSGFFSLVGLIVVIVIIGALFVTANKFYRQSGAEKTVDQVTSDAIDTALQADLNAASVQLKIYLAQNNAYPDANDCNAAPAENTICLKVSTVNQLTYAVDNNAMPPTFNVIAKNSNGASYKITDSTTPVKLTNSK